MPDHVPLPIVAEQRSIKRGVDLELRLFLGAVVLCLLLMFSLGKVLSRAQQVTPGAIAEPPDDAPASALHASTSLQIVAVPPDPPRKPVPRDSAPTPVTQDVAPNPVPRESRPIPPLQSRASGEAPLDAISPTVSRQLPPPYVGRPSSTPTASQRGVATLTETAPLAAVQPAAAPALPPVLFAPSAQQSAASPLQAEPQEGSPTTPASPVPPSGSPTAETGTALYFASDVVLLSLLTQGRIETYVKQGAQWSRVTMGTVAAVEPPDRSLYRLRPDTVPELLRRKLTTGAADTTPEWAVWLEPSIANPVQQFRTSAGAQDLVIGRGGTVRARPRDGTPPANGDKDAAAASEPVARAVY